tara:strand:- start:190 stop:495 length:306 start_codon:yes stop_codon:yes gene_type:complete
MKALIFQNKVVDLKETEFDVHESMTWVDCNDTVKMGDDYDGSNFTTPVEAELTYDTKRRKEYGEIGDQLDLLYKDLVAGKLDETGEWAKLIKQVKENNPKE